MAITFVQAPINTNGSTSAAQQLTMTNTAGNGLVAIFGNEGGTISSVTDTLGNTWVPFPQQSNVGHVSRVFYVLNCKSGSNTITANLSSGSASFAQLAVGEWNPGAGNVFALDASISGTGSGSPDIGPTLVTTKATAVVIAAYDDSLVNVTSIGGGFTQRSATSASTRNGIIDDIVSVTGSYTPTATVGAAAKTWVVLDLYPVPAATSSVDTIANGVCTPAMIYGRAPNGVMSAVTTDGNGNIDLSGQTPAFVDTIANSVCTPVTIYGRAPNGQLQAVTTDGDGQLS